MPLNVKKKWVPFGKEMRRLRSEHGLSLAEVGKRLGVTGAQVGHLERATRVPKRDHVDKLEALYATGGELLSFWKDTMREGRVPDGFRSALAMERKSRHIREYQSILVPGLLQTPDYARTLIRARRPQATSDEVEELVVARMSRMGELQERGTVLWCVLDEVVLLRPIGSERILVDQLQRITDLIEAGTIRLQALPLDNHPGLCAPFRIVTLSDQRSALYLENARGGEIVDKAEQVTEMSMLFSAMQAEALTTRATLEMIRSAKEQLKA
ncbi:helix-turn-helix transcriptional regulator [Nocardiopsis sp. HUAS JQ3]|uniref:helix-turn-helix domain-containing protein n=1 Tax=Nocardiopsis sp. HUAS JQ3 TaxID=3061629 RepID=UPI0023A9CAA9|nr:helix-turn-helix transcriptional regulator [Nocardiopsis sp. HUAS JQ3]WDZ93508.1 helix-turn-helix transcriptional regulator [Nocardiopsis sp. HUAS JQ3]